MGRKPILLQQRFWSKIDIKLDKPDECWEWKAGKDKDGYGKIEINYRDLRAHKVSYELCNGPIEKGLYVCHSCDNPSCVNPTHLFLGTNSDNMLDKIKKGRQSHKSINQGIIHARAKLTNEQVISIRNDNRTTIVIGKEYGLHPSCISRIKNKKQWWHI